MANIVKASLASNSAESPLPVTKRYRSLGAAVKANDAEAVRELCAHLKAEDRLPKDDDEEKPMSTLLWSAAAVASPEVLKTLIEYGADPVFNLMVAGKEEGTVLIFSVIEKAIIAGKVENVEWMLKNGHAKVEDTNNNEHTLLMQAVLEQQFKVADLLLSMGADLYAENLRGNTLLHAACGVPVNIAAIEWLIQNRADPNRQASDGCVPAQRLPEVDHEPEMSMLDALFNALEDYSEAYAKGAPYVLPKELVMNFKGETPEETENGLGDVQIDPDDLEKVMGGMGSTKTKSIPSGSSSAPPSGGGDFNINLSDKAFFPVFDSRAKDYLFTIIKDPMVGAGVAIVHKKYWAANKALNDQEDPVLYEIFEKTYPSGQFGEITESYWEIPRQKSDLSDLIQNLETIGFDRDSTFDAFMNGVSQPVRPKPGP